MLRVSEVFQGQGPAAQDGPAPVPRHRTARLAALGLLGLALGAGGMALTVSLVQAEDDAGIRALFREEAARRAQQGGGPSAYAPTTHGWRLPLFGTNPDGRIPHPPVALESGRPRGDGKGRPGRYDTVSGAANVARTICVRLCDGYHMPIGHLRSQADFKAQEALCSAMNPGIPVKLFRVAAGATTIDGAVAADGKTYGSLPVAHGHETSADSACRPAIPSPGERRVSLLRDFTLRPGDAVVLDGKVTTFEGSTSWPYSTRDFREFRSSSELSAGTRRMIDETVGVSSREAMMRSLRRDMDVQEALVKDDAPVLRGRLGSGPLASVAPSAIRQIVIAPET